MDLATKDVLGDVPRIRLIADSDAIEVIADRYPYIEHRDAANRFTALITPFVGEHAGDGIIGFIISNAGDFCRRHNLNRNEIRGPALFDAIANDSGLMSLVRYLDITRGKYVFRNTLAS